MCISKIPLPFAASILAISLTSSVFAVGNDEENKKVVTHKRQESERIPNAIMEYEKGNVYTAIARAPSGAKLYFNMVKITKNNFDFWETYLINVRPVAGCKRGLLSYLYNFYERKNSLTAKEYNKEELELMAITGLNSKEFKDLMGKIESFDKEKEKQYDSDQKKYKNEKSQGKLDIERPYLNSASSLFLNLDVGIQGAKDTLSGVSGDLCHIFIAFASTVPLSKIYQDQSPPRSYTTDDLKRQFEDFKNAYGKIVLSMNVIHNPQAPTSTHFGIFRNPLDIHESFLTGNNPHRDISMLLHGFAATVEQKYFQNKVYMNTWPVKSMMSILTSNLGSENIEPTSNLDHLVRGLNKKWDFTQITLSGQPLAIKLEHLVPLFIKAVVTE